MNNQQKNIQKTTFKDYLPFLILFLSMIVIFSVSETGKGDDSWYFGWKLGELQERYLTYHGKVIIDALLMILLHLPRYVWVVVTSLIYTLLAYWIVYLFSDMQFKFNMIICLLLCCYPMHHMNTAGWVATTVNYIWPCSFGIASFLPIKFLFNGKKVHPAFVGWMIPLILISCNQEQMGAIVCCVHLIMGVYYCFMHKKIPAWYVGLTVLTMGSIIFLLLSPGTRARMVNELRWYPAHASFSFLQKLYLGVVATSAEIVFNPNGISIILALFLLFFSICQKSIWKAICGSIPFGMMLLNFLDGTWVTRLFPLMEEWIAYGRSFTLEFGTMQPQEALPFDFRNMIMMIWALLFVICIFLTVFMMLERKNRYLGTIVLAAGFCSRWIIGFSPTVYASRDRTFFFLYIAVAITILLLYPVCEKKEVIKEQKSYLLFALLAIWSIGNTLAGSLVI